MSLIKALFCSFLQSGDRFRWRPQRCYESSRSPDMEQNQLEGCRYDKPLVQTLQLTEKKPLWLCLSVSDIIVKSQGAKRRQVGRITMMKEGGEGEGGRANTGKWRGGGEKKKKGGWSWCWRRIKNGWWQCCRGKFSAVSPHLSASWQRCRLRPRSSGATGELMCCYCTRKCET